MLALLILSSRTISHKSKRVISLTLCANEFELTAIAKGLVDAGHGLLKWSLIGMNLVRRRV